MIELTQEMYDAAQDEVAYLMVTPEIRAGFRKALAAALAVVERDLYVGERIPAQPIDTSWRKPRIRACVEAWPGCEDGAYDPKCCRFPKSRSCTAYDSEQVTEEYLEPQS